MQSDTRREIMPQCSSAKIDLGNVGYVFCKRFDSGWFTGEVVEILPPVNILVVERFGTPLSHQGEPVSRARCHGHQGTAGESQDPTKVVFLLALHV